ncbi:MAG: hypothetical protein ACRD01_14450 [Terriglobales bacterium]
MKITAVLGVDAIEPLLDFWVGRMGFDKTVEVPHQGRLGLVILARGGAEFMIQALAAARDDVPQLTPQAATQAALFIEVDDFDDITRQLGRALSRAGARCRQANVGRSPTSGRASREGRPRRRLQGYPVALPERKTFYGMREIGVRDPGGNAVIFAVPVPGAAA